MKKKTEISQAAKTVVKAIQADKDAEAKLSAKDALGTGCTVLNMGLCGKPFGGIRRGGVYLWWGDSSAGKTVLTYTMLAELTINPKFKDYKIVVDDVEEGALMDIQRYFGPKLAARIEPPARHENGDAKPSVTVEDCYDTLNKLCDAGRPFIYVADSESAMTSVYAIKKADEARKARTKAKEAAGSYGDGKAKVHSENLRIIKSRIRETGSIVMFLCQSRDNIGFGAQFNPKTRPGGHALKFYAHVELQLQLGKKLKKDVRGKKRTIGIQMLVTIKKNRLTGRVGTLTPIPIYYSVGIDETGACIDYLLSENHWKKVKGKIDAKELEVCLPYDALVEHIESNDLNRDLSLIVKKVWNEIETECKVIRKSRYE